MIRGLRVPVNLTSRDALRILDLAEIWASRTGHEIRVVSANDHVHSRRSAHYAGLALDLQSSDMDGLADMLRRAGFRVLWKVPGHFAHVHAEYPDVQNVSSRPLTPPAPAVNRASRARAGTN